MKIINLLPPFLEALRRWDTAPSRAEFEKDYYERIQIWTQPMVQDFSKRFGGSLYDVLVGLNWQTYRAEALRLNPLREEERVKKHLLGVQNLLGTALKGEIVLFGAFTAMDGYARFDQGTHRVYLGVDESHGRGSYLDVLISHELTHVARESIECIWTGFGLNPRMSHDEFARSMPVIEHLMSEGFSCAVSEILNPQEEPWHYVYQSQDTLDRILEHGPALDKVIHSELKKKRGDYGSLYDTSRYIPRLPLYAHYVWAWQWAKHLLRTRAGGDPKNLLAVCANELVDDALEFKLETIV